MWVELISISSLLLNVLLSMFIYRRWRKDREADDFIAEMAEKYKTSDECPMCGADLDEETEYSPGITAYFEETRCSICKGELNTNGDCKSCGFNSEKFDADNKND